MTNYCLRNRGTEKNPEWHCDPIDIDLPGAREACDFKTGNRDPIVSSREAALMKNAHCPYRGPENDCIKIQGKTSKGNPRLTLGSDDNWHDQNKVDSYIDRNGKRIPGTHPDLRDRDVMCEGSVRGDRRKRKRGSSYSVREHVAYKDMYPNEVDDLLLEYGLEVDDDETDRQRLRRLVEVAEGPIRRVRRRVDNDRSYVIRESDYCDARGYDSDYSAGFEAGRRSRDSKGVSQRIPNSEAEEILRGARQAVRVLIAKKESLKARRRLLKAREDPDDSSELQNIANELEIVEASGNKVYSAYESARQALGQQSEGYIDEQVHNMLIDARNKAAEAKLAAAEGELELMRYKSGDDGRSAASGVSRFSQLPAGW